MDDQINVLLLCGGGSTEHEVSLVSAKYFLEKLNNIEGIKPYYVEIAKDGLRRDLNGQICELRKDGELVYKDLVFGPIKLDFAIPCLHGYPGETGQIPGRFEMMNLPYLGPNLEASSICFNKITTKLWMNALGIPTTPFIFLKDITRESLAQAIEFFHENQQDIFVKASNQGSAIGTYHITQESELEEKLQEALELSSFCLLEKTIHGRELEVAVYEFEGKLEVSKPGEIKVPTAHYTYEEKYSTTSKAQCLPIAPNISKVIQEEIRTYARVAFEGLKLKHLSRVDFFLTDNQIYLNEINTMPGHTPISMFPMMMEASGHQYEKFLENIIKNEARR